MSRCTWNADGQQCKWPGVFSASLNGGGPWRCFWHRNLGSGFDDQHAGREIVRQSWQWDETPEGYMAARMRSEVGNAKAVCMAVQSIEDAGVPANPAGLSADGVADAGEGGVKERSGTAGDFLRTRFGA